jgi:hypothetical protein
MYEFYSSSPITGFLLAGYIGTTLYKQKHSIYEQRLEKLLAKANATSLLILAIVTNVIEEHNRMIDYSAIIDIQYELIVTYF